MSEKQNKDLDVLMYSVVLIDNHPMDNPTRIGEWNPRNDEPPSWEADLNAHQFAELCRDLGLRASCTTQGTQGAAGFDPHHWTPAYCFCDPDEYYEAWVTPWTPAIKAAALAEIAGQKPADLPVLGEDQPAHVLWLPLWGDRWSEIEKMLDREFSEDRRSMEIEPVERFDVETEVVADALKREGVKIKD